MACPLFALLCTSCNLSCWAEPRQCWRKRHLFQALLLFDLPKVNVPPRVQTEPYIVTLAVMQAVLPDH